MACCGKGCYDCVKNIDQEDDSFELLDDEEFDYSPRS